MTLELIYNGILLVFFIFCYFYVGVTMPKSASTELGADNWPQIILVLLIIFLAINMYKVYKGNKDIAFKDLFKGFNIKSFVKNKLFVGIVLVFLMALILDIVGFIPTCFLFIIAYGYLVGEKRILRLILSSIAVTIILYIIFSIGLDIMLPRGYGIFRTFALILESFI